MDVFKINWDKKHIVKTNTILICDSDEINSKSKELRKEIEPWLSAILQSEHLSLLIGTGLTTAVTYIANVNSQGMPRLELKHEFSSLVIEKANKSATTMNRGEANFEDDIRTSLELINGLRIIDDPRVGELEMEVFSILSEFISNILKTEKEFASKLASENLDSTSKIKPATESFNLLKSFILSFSSRAASRERLNIFTTNYDRFIELACDEVGVLLLDRFKGKIRPIFRNSRLELDYHYNPPGIRGEPRYVEGVSRLTKLHGSIDWKFFENKVIRTLLPFGADITHPEIENDNSKQVVIYPNSSKDIETSLYPYSELFRDFSTAICQPNSVIITYGYGFGDSHINRIIEDMLTIPSTHLVIISWDKEENKDGVISFGAPRERIVKFLESKNSAQCTLLIGEHFGDLKNLVDFYLPKSAIDRLTIKMEKLKEDRGEKKDNANSDSVVTLIEGKNQNE